MQIERREMSSTKHDSIRGVMTECRTTEGGIFKSVYYEVRVTVGSRQVYISKHEDVNNGWKDVDRLRKYLLIGRCHA